MIFKKLFNLLLLTSILLSCSEENTPLVNSKDVNSKQQKIENNNFYENTSSKNEKIDDYQNWYINLSGWVNKYGENLSLEDFDQPYVLSPDNKDIDMLSVTLKENSVRGNIPSNFQVNGFLNDVDLSSYTNKLNNMHAIIVQRNISSNDNRVNIKEFISVKTGEIIYHQLQGMTEEEYVDFIEANYSYTYLNETICFTTMQSCEENLANNTGSGINGAICDYMPCGTINFLACQMLGQNGQIESSCNFVGCQYCDVIYGSPYYYPEELELEPIIIEGLEDVILEAEFEI